MLNHYHIQLQAPSAVALSSFMRDLNASFTRLYNQHYRRRGPLFCARFKNAGKHKEQKIRENYIYICNNPVLKRAVPAAWLYRWNFLAYMQSEHPFSRAGRTGGDENLEQVEAIIRTRRAAGHPLDYNFFDGLYSRLDETQRKHILDYAIVNYNVIDYKEVGRMWLSYGQLCETLQTVRGTEYDLDDDDMQEDYQHYYKMIRIVQDQGYDLMRCRLDHLPYTELMRLSGSCVEKAGASRVEIAKFFHCPFV